MANKQQPPSKEQKETRTKGGASRNERQFAERFAERNNELHKLPSFADALEARNAQLDSLYPHAPQKSVET